MRCILGDSLYLDSVKSDSTRIYTDLLCYPVQSHLNAKLFAPHGTDAGETRSIIPADRSRIKCTHSNFEPTLASMAFDLCKKYVFLTILFKLDDSIFVCALTRPRNRFD